MADTDTFAKLAGFARKAGLRPEVAEVLARRMGAAGGEPAGTPLKQSRPDMSEIPRPMAPDTKRDGGCGTCSLTTTPVLDHPTDWLLGLTRLRVEGK